MDMLQLIFYLGNFCFSFILGYANEVETKEKEKLLTWDKKTNYNIYIIYIKMPLL